MTPQREVPNREVPRAAGRKFAVLAALAVIAAGTLWPHSAGAQNDRLKDIERAIEQDRSRAAELKRQAEKLAQEIQALRVESVALARKTQDHETDLSALEAQLPELQSQERDMLATLTARREQLGQTLAALQRIALQPSDALLLAPAAPVDTVRSGLLLRAAIPAIETRAVKLRGELDALRDLRQRIAVRRDQMSVTTQAMAEDRKRLETLIARKSEAREALTAGQEAAQKRAESLALRAKDLRELMDKVEREAAELAAREQAARDRAVQEQIARDQAARAAQEQAAQSQATQSQATQSQATQSQATQPQTAQKPAEAPASQPQVGQSQAGDPAPGGQIALAQPPNIRPFPASGQSLVLPARGKMKTHFGETQGDGSAARGIVIAARGGAQVVAPFDGKVVYAGIFRSYGQILIIEHGGRYHTLLAGMERVDAVVGQWLLAGEPVGVLGSPRGSGPELYLELRHAGQPINPLPWLATTGDKVRG
jgi:septal ring factor EnvC (AmiA/AmiB activator)